MKGSDDVAKILLQYGAKVNEPNTEGFAPLHLATFSRNVDVVRVLCMYGAHKKIR
jgi:ankyrin repeat protein